MIAMAGARARNESVKITEMNVVGGVIGVPIRVDVGKAESNGVIRAG